MSHDQYLETILGKDVFAEIKSSKVLLVGAGGIGCELLKDLVLMGYGEIHIVDLDTIDLSNLNRQFLFRQKDIKKPKSSTAVAAVENFNVHNSKMISYTANIMDTKLFPINWFDQFKFIFNALDNIAARSYVNKMGLFLKKTIVESGTTGFNGQVTPIFPYNTECYDCTIKETPKTYPVCTIRSTPSQPVHCVHWAKNFLFSQLFENDEDDNEELTSNFETDNEEEIKNMKNEQNELKELKDLITKDEVFYEKFIEKIFIKDIEKLLKLEELWKSRKKPIPLNLKAYKEKVSKLTDEDVKKGQETWPIENFIYLLIKSIKSLQNRIINENEKIIEFDKDDEDTLDFVVSTTNIRSFIFDIPLKSKFAIKQIAGNIIPAIATTNAIISGFSALCSLSLLNDTKSKLIYTFQDSTRFISSSDLFPKNPNCKSCSIPRDIIKINLSDKSIVLNYLIESILENFNYDDEEISIILGKDKLLYDVEFDDNKNSSLEKLGFKYGEIITIIDENDKYSNIELYIEELKDGKIELPKIDLPLAPIKEESKEDDIIKKNDDFEAVEDDEIVIVDEDENDKKRSLEIETGTPSKKQKII